jgi:hypothetical protein
VIGGDPARRREHLLYRELLYALESARSSLAIAIAAESKTTPRERWRHYLETQDRMRRCVRDFRRVYGLNFSRHPGWLRALELLQQPLPEGDKRREKAQPLCQRLYDVLNVMELTLQITSDE